ncbi:putative efflux system protein [Yersinia nurmii]|uniref:Efflux system protein n=2 Tax=Yersinia nurmii TaxID=685706 RepID=A0ABP1YBZ7_9GAMM|nr:putative efflux system protein [Yersinia nurmii]
MKILIATLFLVLPTAVFSANPQAHQHMHQPDASSASVETLYQSQGKIKAWGTEGVSISHQAIPALNWPPMTMSFSLPTAGNLQPLTVGTEVDFRFRQTAQGYELVSIAPHQS